jgi:Resolvase, N terminal domain
MQASFPRCAGAPAPPRLRRVHGRSGPVLIFPGDDASMWERDAKWADPHVVEVAVARLRHRFGQSPVLKKSRRPRSATDGTGLPRRRGRRSPSPRARRRCGGHLRRTGSGRAEDPFGLGDWQLGVATGRAGGLIVAKLDRLSRSLLDFAALMERSRREGWALIALDLGVDTSTPQGELMARCWRPSLSSSGDSSGSERRPH